MTCGACTAATSTTLFSITSSVTTFDVTDAFRESRGFWFQPSFPNPPCTTPNLFIFTWFEVGVSSIWRQWDATNSPITATGQVTATVGPFPAYLGDATGSGTPWRPNRTGTFRVRTERPNCGASFYSAYFEFTATDTTGSLDGGSVMLHSKAGVL